MSRLLFSLKVEPCSRSTNEFFQRLKGYNLPFSFIFVTSICSSVKNMLAKWKDQLVEIAGREISAHRVELWLGTECHSSGERAGDDNGFKCEHQPWWWNIRKNHFLPLTVSWMLFFLSVGHWDYQHSDSDRSHRGHSCQNGLHRDEWSSDGRLRLCAVQVNKWRHCKGTVRRCTSTWRNPL